MFLMRIKSQKPALSTVESTLRQDHDIILEIDGKARNKYVVYIRMLSLFLLFPRLALLYVIAYKHEAKTVMKSSHNG